VSAPRLGVDSGRCDSFDVSGGRAMAITTAMRLLATIAFALALLLSPDAFAASQQDYDDCSQADDFANRVAACSRIIANPDEAAADRAAALIQLGNVDVAANELDQAIADYSGAILFDANDIVAYAGRAISYWRKNDRAQAVADYNRAADIDTAALRGMSTANTELGAIGQFASEDDSAVIRTGARLDEVRQRLYELNFDPGASGGPADDATNQAIRGFQQKNNLPPTGVATMGLLRQLRGTASLEPWGTIVFDKESGKWGMAWDESTRKAAVARARASCGSSACPVEISFFGGACGAFAHSDSGWAIDARNDIETAKDAALGDCRQRGRSCKIIASVCANGAERSSSAR
jgi:tetratricopeptide (TPR) repeat protein